MFGFSHIVGETTRKERLKTGAESSKGERYRRRAEFFALPLDDSPGFRYLVSRHETRGQSGDCDWGSEWDRKSDCETFLR
jgi:hypothetical protein